MAGEVAPDRVGLRRVVAEERPPADARGVGDLVGGDVLEPAQREQVEGRPLDARPRPLGRAPAGAVSVSVTRSSCPVLPLALGVISLASSVRDRAHLETSCPGHAPPLVTRSPGVPMPETPADVETLDAPAVAEEALVEESLVEEVSIDGMCGVY